MDFLTREYLRREIDSRMRQNIEKLKNDSSGKINRSRVFGDRDFTPWPPYTGQSVDTLVQHKRKRYTNKVNAYRNNRIF